MEADFFVESFDKNVCNIYNYFMYSRRSGSFACQKGVLYVLF